MHFSTFTTTFLAILTLATSSPLLDTSSTTPPAHYYLQTKVVNGAHKDCGTNKTELYIYSYHTGAGLGDAGLSSNKSIAWQGYLNGTQQLFTTTGNNLGPWPLSISDAPYTVWNPATISIADQVSTTGFFFNSTGLQYNQSVGGWLACDWSHGVPQLFNLNGYPGNGFGQPAVIPSSCSKVQLLPVAV